MGKSKWKEIRILINFQRGEVREGEGNKKPY